MKNLKYLFVVGILYSAFDVNAQVGINAPTPNSTLEVNGSFSRKVTQITTTTTLQISHSVIICNPSTAIDVVLPDAITSMGRMYIIKNITSYITTIKPQNGQKVEGASTFLLQNINATIQVMSDGSNWFVLDKYIP